MTTIITPTIGRRVWYWPSQYDLGQTLEQIAGTAASSSPTMYQVHEGQPFDAGIVFVWSNHMVNLVVTDHAGEAQARTSVRLLQGDEQRQPGVACATWMPYQRGQAQANAPQTPYPCPIAAEAPTVTLDQVDAEIVATHYFRADQGAFAAEWNPTGSRPAGGVKLGDFPLSLLTFCVLVLKNGFTVTGKSACASPAKFDAEIGRQIAREDAIRKVWPLLGYQLRQKLHEASTTGVIFKRDLGDGNVELDYYSEQKKST